MMKRSIVFMIFITALFFGTASAKTYKIGTVAWPGFSPANVADVKGFWSTLGLDVQVLTYTTNTNMHKALENKRIDFAIDITGVWIEQFMRGIPVVILAEIDWSKGGDKIIKKKGLDVNTLKGQPIGVFSRSVMPLLHKYLVSQGLQMSSVKMVELGTDALAKNFIANRFQMIVCYNPDALKAENEGKGEVVATSATYPGSITDSIVARADVIKDIPLQDVVNIFKGWIMAVQWLNEEKNWEEFKNILNTKTFPKDPTYSDKELREMLDGVRILDTIMLQQQNKAEGDFLEYLREYKTLLKANGLLEKDFQIEKLFDNTAITKALESFR